MTTAAAQNLTVPIIHLNGSSRDTLLDQWSDAYDALNTAYDKLKECGPNGRDYYLLPGNALKSATDEHLARLRRIDDVMKELQSLSEAIAFA